MAELDKCYVDYEELYDDTNFLYLDEEYIKTDIPTSAISNVEDKTYPCNL